MEYLLTGVMQAWCRCATSSSCNRVTVICGFLQQIVMQPLLKPWPDRVGDELGTRLRGVAVVFDLVIVELVTDLLADSRTRIEEFDAAIAEKFDGLSAE